MRSNWRDECPEEPLAVCHAHPSRDHCGHIDTHDSCCDCGLTVEGEDDPVFCDLEIARAWRGRPEGEEPQ